MGSTNAQHAYLVVLPIYATSLSQAQIIEAGPADPDNDFDGVGSALEALNYPDDTAYRPDLGAKPILVEPPAGMSAQDLVQEVTDLNASYDDNVPYAIDNSNSYISSLLQTAGVNLNQFPPSLAASNPLWGAPGISASNFDVTATQYSFPVTVNGFTEPSNNNVGVTVWTDNNAGPYGGQPTLLRVSVDASQVIGANGLAITFNPADGIGTPFTIATQFFSALLGYDGNINIGQSLFYQTFNW